MLNQNLAEGMMELMKGKSQAAAQQAALSTEATDIVELIIKQLGIKSGGYDTHQAKLSEAFTAYVEQLSPAQLGTLACQFKDDLVAYLYGSNEPNYAIKSVQDLLADLCNATLLFEAVSQLGDG